MVEDAGLTEKCYNEGRIHFFASSVEDAGLTEKCYNAKVSRCLISWC